MTDFLLELRCEEIPARMQDGARAELEKLFAAELAKAGLKTSNLVSYATPRRLVLIAYDMPLETHATSEETKGPKTSAPPQALEGFLRKTGLTQDQLTERDGVYFAIINKPGRKTADVLAEAIPAIIRGFSWPKSMRWGAASASTESLRWVRPLQGIVALFGDEPIVCGYEGIESGRETMGHRFHPNDAEDKLVVPIHITSPDNYADQLHKAHVIVDQAERQAIIRDGAAKAAADAGLILLPDEALVAENAGLTEWPVPLLGRFDEAFLAVPPEVIRLTAKLNQKYFMCEQRTHAGGMASSGASDGKLANAFVCTANISAHDGGAAIIAGNERVLAARLSDAKFFYEQDLKTPLAVHAEKLSNIVFHEKLGTVADKVARVAKLARWLVESGVVHPRAPSADPEPSGSAGQLGSATRAEHSNAVAALADMAEQAARLCKADLVTGMVGEFPELQGVMGGYYARAQGLPNEVADAIRDHYKPVGQGDDVPTAPVTVAVSLADKLDTLVGFFAVDERPTGSKDPLALRRSTLAIINLIVQNRLSVSIKEAWEVLGQCLLDQAHTRAMSADYIFEFAQKYGQPEFSYKPVNDGIEFTMSAEGVSRTSTIHVQEEYFGIKLLTALYFGASTEYRSLADFFADRLKVQQKEAGVRHDLIDAVFATKNEQGAGEDDLVRLLARVKALQAFITTEDGANLLAGYKRAANILKQSSAPGGDPEPSGLAGHLGSASSAEHRAPATLLPVETRLLNALDSADPQVEAALATEDFTRAMSTLATLRAPIDQFFTDVMVNDPDAGIRAFRLGLLARFRDAVHKVADFSKIEG